MFMPSKKKKLPSSHPHRKTPRKRETPKEPLPPVHPWRVCPYGEHWVRKHPLHIPPGILHPEGHTVTRREHCARNPSGRDQLYPEEMKEMAAQHFPDAKIKPCPLTLKFDNGSKYDDLIAGWVQYWNDIFKPDVLLDPNLVKALIASESSFNPDILAGKNHSNSARGLMQITNDTREILGDDQGELKDHYITVTKEDLNDPGVNIGSGVRWLFQKRKLATKPSKPPPSWVDIVWKYKATSIASKEKRKQIKETFGDYLKKLQQCKK